MQLSYYLADACVTNLRQRPRATISRPPSGYRVARIALLCTASPVEPLQRPYATPKLPGDVQALLSDFEEVLHEFRGLQLRLNALGIETCNIGNISSSSLWDSQATALAQAQATILADSPSGEVRRLIRQYAELKQRIMHESPKLHQRLKEKPSSKRKSFAPGSTAKSCNEDADRPRISSVGQWVKAKDYRRTRQSRASDITSTTGNESVAESWVHALGFTDMVRTDSAEMDGEQAPHVDPVLAESEELKIGLVEAATSIPKADDRSALPALPHLVLNSALPVKVDKIEVGQNANSRIKAAALAASKYRKTKVEKTSVEVSGIRSLGSSLEPCDQSGLVIPKVEDQQQSQEGAAEILRSSGDVYAGRKCRISSESDYLVCP